MICLTRQNGNLLSADLVLEQFQNIEEKDGGKKKAVFSDIFIHSRMMHAQIAEQSSFRKRFPLSLSLFLFFLSLSFSYFLVEKTSRTKNFLPTHWFLQVLKHEIPFSHNLLTSLSLSFFLFSLSLSLILIIFVHHHSSCSLFRSITANVDSINICFYFPENFNNIQSRIFLP